MHEKIAVMTHQLTIVVVKLSLPVNYIDRSFSGLF